MGTLRFDPPPPPSLKNQGLEREFFKTENGARENDSEKLALQAP